MADEAQGKPGATIKLVDDRRSKCYAFFLDGEQDGNWMAYVADDEPRRIADSMDIELEVKP